MTTEPDTDRLMELQVALTQFIVEHIDMSKSNDVMNMATILLKHSLMLYQNTLDVSQIQKLLKVISDEALFVKPDDTHDIPSLLH